MVPELITAAGFVLLLVLGAVMLAGAVLNWDRLYQDWRSRFVIRTAGRRGARLLQGLVGVLLALTGLLGLLGG